MTLPAHDAEGLQVRRPRRRSRGEGRSMTEIIQQMSHVNTIWYYSRMAPISECNLEFTAQCIMDNSELDLSRHHLRRQYTLT